MIKTVEQEGCKWYMLDEEEYCKYQCLQDTLREWQRMLDEAKLMIKDKKER